MFHERKMELPVEQSHSDFPGNERATGVESFPDEEPLPTVSGGCLGDCSETWGMAIMGDIYIQCGFDSVH